MATYFVLKANGSIGTSTNWASCDTTSASDSEAANTALTTSFTKSNTFTPGAITIDGILVKLASRAASPTGTVTVALDQANSTVTNTSVTVNVSDLPTCSTGSTNNEGGWFLFKFGSSVLLVTATAYSVKATTSSSSQVNLYSTTATNWSRLLRTTTTGTPSTTDSIIITGEWTAATTVTARSCTMDSTSTSNILINNGASSAVSICNNGTLTWGSSASTAYYLKLGSGTTAAGITIYNGGTMAHNSPPSTSSQVLEFNINAGSADGFDWVQARNGSTWSATGVTIAAYATTLTSDVAANASTFAVASNSGWAATDNVMVTSTTRTAADSEIINISTMSGSGPYTITVSVGGGSGGNTMKNAHGGGGTTNVVAEVLHLSRNIKLRTTQTALASTGTWYCYIAATATVTLSYCEFSYMGANTANQRGIEIATTTGSCTLTGCVIDNCRNWGLYLVTASGSVTIDKLCMDNVNTVGAASTNGFLTTATTGTHSLTNIYLSRITTPASGVAAILGDAGSTYTGLYVSGSVTGSSGHAVQCTENAAGGTWNNWNIHSNAGFGFSPASTAGVTNLTIGSAGSPCYAWRNNGGGYHATVGTDRITLDSWTVFGNTTDNFLAAAQCGLLWLKSPTSRSDATFSTSNGLTVGSVLDVLITNGNFGATTAHVQDWQVTANSGGQVVAYGTTFNSASGVPTISSTCMLFTIFRSHKDGGGTIATSSKWWTRTGAVASDATHVHGSQTFAWKCTPNANASATNPFYFPGPLTTGTQKQQVYASPVTGFSLTVYVYLNASGGTGVTLTVVGGPIAGVGSWGTNTTVATTTTGSFQALTITGLIPTDVGAIEWFLSADSATTVFWVGDIVPTET